MRKLLSTTIAVGIFASVGFTSAAFADVAAGALPSLNNATNADVTTAGNNMNIQIQGGQGSVGTLNWNSYNVGSDATVNYEFSAHNQTALNKVAATGGLSQIYGKITSSGCAGCGYDATGKVILINPNGVLFGDGANVNLNSFTVSTFDGTFDKDTNQLTLDRNGQTSKYGIVVQEGAKIHGDKAVNFASDNVTVYNGSQISTNVAPNYNKDENGAYTDSFGKVKIVTADGVNFAYYNNGATKAVSATGGSEKMMIHLNGDIQSGNIDVRNMSTHEDSQINLNGATLKATKAVSGNDGNIWLTAANKVVIADSKLQTVNYSDAAAAKNGGDIQIVADKKVSIGTTDIDAVGNVYTISKSGDVVIDATQVKAAKDAIITAGNIASIQNGSTVKAAKVAMTAGNRAQVVASDVDADEIEITGADVWTNNAKLTAAKTIKATATDGYVLAEATTMKSAKNTISAATNVEGDIDTQESLTEIYAGKDINVKLANVGNKSKGLVAEAGKNVTITTDGTLSVSRLVAKDGDMTLTANKIVAGTPYTAEEKIPGDASERSYIYVKNGKFTSNTANDSYEVTASDTLTADGKYQQRHHIQYGNGSEKILLINNRPYTAPEEPQPPVVTPEPQDKISVDDDQASMLNKIQRRPVTLNNTTNIADGRTTFVDVFAAASQIEIEDDEE